MNTDSTTFLQRAIDIVSSIFLPLLGLLAGTGLLKAFLALAFQLEWIDPDDTNAIILDTVSNSFFYALPVMLAYTSAKTFHTHVLTALTLGFALIYPNLVELLNSGHEISFLGLPIQTLSYASSVLPIVIAVWALGYVERALTRALPKAVHDFLRPTLALLIMIPITLVVIGPLAMFVGHILGSPLSWLFTAYPPISSTFAGALFGAGFPLLQIFGLHWGIVPLIIQEVSQNGYSLMLAPLMATVAGQGSACVAVTLRSRTDKLRATSASGAVSALLAGVGEPALYGVLLPLRKPLVASCIGGAIGGAIIAAGGVAPTAFVLTGLLAIPAFLSHGSVIALLTGISVSMVVSFTLTLILWPREEQKPY